MGDEVVGSDINDGAIPEVDDECIPVCIPVGIEPDIARIVLDVG
jgi:hypothetical protein